MEVDSNLIEEFRQLSRESVEFTKKCALLVEGEWQLHVF